MISIDMDSAVTGDLIQLQQRLAAELSRRATIINAPVKSEEAARKYLKASGLPEGSEWVQPSGAYDAYPLGYEVTHQSETWRSTIAANVREPGVSGWRLVADDGPVETDSAPRWLQPTGAHDAYRAGTFVLFDGLKYVSVISGNVWSPADYPTAWELVTNEPDTEPEPEPELPPVWEQPTGAENSYSIGDQVSFNGQIYSSLINGNAYSPVEYPAGWELQTAPVPEPTVPQWRPQEWPTTGYSIGDRVTFEGQVYVSLININADVPNEAPESWRLETDVVPDPDPEPEPEPPAPTVPDFVQPTGAHNAYAIGARVTFAGKVYESLIASNVYSPSAYPAGWKLV